MTAGGGEATTAEIAQPPDTVVEKPSITGLEIALKIHSRCNLGCPDCYVYEGVDQGWRELPRQMSMDILAQAAGRIGEHAQQEELDIVSVVLHGGEPLLVGAGYLRQAAQTLREAVPSKTDLSIGVQTNGIPLSWPGMLETLRDEGIRVGVSLDGPQATNDLYRPHPNGRGSYGEVAANLERLRDEFPSIYAGILCTVHPGSDPIETYKTLLSFKPPKVDFLLKYATWDNPPERPTETFYQDWHTALFDYWADLPGEQYTRIRTFESIINLFAGRPSLVELWGINKAPGVFIQTDGSYEDFDHLSVTYPGAKATGLHVLHNTIEEFNALPAVRARLAGWTALSQTCQECPIVKICGGGRYTDRYRTGSGFCNPSVYCPDLLGIVNHINRRLLTLVNPTDTP